MPADQSITSRKVDLTIAHTMITTAETTTSTSYTDLATSGPAITVTPGVTQEHLVTLQCHSNGSGAINDTWMSISIAGAAADDADGRTAGLTSAALSGLRVRKAASQTSGATHTAKYKVSANTGNYSNRRAIGVAI